MELQNNLARLVYCSLITHTKARGLQAMVHAHAAEEGGAVIICKLKRIDIQM